MMVIFKVLQLSLLEWDCGIADKIRFWLRNMRKKKKSPEFLNIFSR